MIQVLQMIDTLNAGGAERMAVNIATSTYFEQHEIHLCTTRAEGLLKKQLLADVPYFFLKKKSAFDIQAIQRLLNYIKEENISIIHAHSTSIYLAYAVKIIRPKLKLIWHDHYGLSEFVSARPKQRLLIMISRKMGGIVSCNVVLKQWAATNLKCNKTIYLPNFSRQTAVLNTEETLLFGQDGKRIVCLANLREQKNHLELIEVFSSVLTRFPDWSLHLVGQDFKDSYSKSIKALIQTEGLRDSVFMYGSRPDIHAILQKSAIGVLFSHSEGLPLSLLEYANAGLPVVVTNVGLNKEVVGICGSVIESPLQEGEQALEFLINSQSVREKLGADFKQKVLAEYNEKSIIQTLESFYH